MCYRGKAELTRFCLTPDMREAITLKSVAAIVVASAVTGDPMLAAHSSNGCKSLITINGRPAVSYVLENLRACERISNVVLISDRATYNSAPGADFFVEASSSEAESLLRGVRLAADWDRCLVTTGDLPLASPDAITDLLTCAPDCDIVYPIVEETDVRDVYPGKRAFYIGTKEGRFTGSSSLLFKPRVALSREELITGILNARRNPTALLGLLGPGMAVKIMLGKPTVADFESQLSKALQATCRVFISHYPELICSIDSPEDIEMMESELA